MTTELYRQSIRSPRWRQLKWRRLKISGYSCERCGVKCPFKRPRQCMRFFHLHHLPGSYRMVGAEDLECVQILCPSCHFHPSTHPWRIP